MYAVTHQLSGITQGLVTSKSRLAKKGLTTPRLELVAGHMATNLVDNVKEALQGFPIRSVYGWLDSSVALHWIKGGGNYKQFVGNRVSKIEDLGQELHPLATRRDDGQPCRSRKPRWSVIWDNRPVLAWTSMVNTSTTVASRYRDKSDQRDASWGHTYQGSTSSHHWNK